MKRGLVSVLLLIPSVGCSVDTELGVGAEGLGATVVVEGDPATVEAEIHVRFRVGEFAPSNQSFVPTAIGVNVGESNAAMAGIQGIVGFDGTLDPGEERTVRVASDPASTMVQAGARSLLCAGNPVRVVLSYEFAEGERMPGELPDFRSVAVPSATVDCR